MPTSNSTVWVYTSQLSAIANAIRSQNGTLSSYTLNQMPSAIRAIPTGPSVFAATPELTINPATGVVTATTNQQAGLVSNTSAIGTLNLAFQPAVIITPTESTQMAVSSGRWLGGDVTVAAIPSNYTSDPYYNIYKSLAYNSIIYSNGSNVSNWCNSFSFIESGTFGDRRFAGNFIWRNVEEISYLGFAKTAEGFIGGGITSFNFPICSIIGFSAFFNNRDLYHISASNCTSIGSFCFYNTNLSEASFPSVINMGWCAFSACLNLSYINFPLLENIPDNAFMGCSRLNNINIPQCLNIGIAAFASCKSLTSISFSLCTSLGNYAFQSCSNLTNVYFPECQTIGQSCFYNNINLTSIYFPKVTSIGTGAFSSCNNLSQVNFSILSNLDACFQYCFNLSIISLGGTFSIIKPYTFSRCYNLLSLYLNTSSLITLSNANAFISTPISNYTTSTNGTYGSIYVPASLYSAYLTATNWSLYSNRIVSF